MWIIFTLLASFIWAIVNFIDKEITEKKIPSMGLYYIFSGLGSLIFAIGIWIYLGGLYTLPWFYVSIVFLGGGTFSFMMWFYLKSLKIEEASFVVPLFNFSPVWGAVLAYVFLGEILVGSDLWAFIIILFGGLILSTEKLSLSIFALRPVFFMMLISTFFVAIVFVSFKYVHQIFPNAFWTLYAWQLLGQTASCLLFVLCLWKKGLFGSFKKTFRPVFPLFMFNDFISFIAFAFYLWALALAPVALVGAIGGSQGFFVFSIGLFMTWFFPHMVKESVHKEVIFQKLIGILIMFVGVALLELM